jgi:hypothetical protein
MIKCLRNTVMGLCFGPGFIALGTFTFIRIHDKVHDHRISYGLSVVDFWGALVMIGVGIVVAAVLANSLHKRVRS